MICSRPPMQHRRGGLSQLDSFSPSLWQEADPISPSVRFLLRRARCLTHRQGNLTRVLCSSCRPHFAGSKCNEFVSQDRALPGVHFRSLGGHRDANVVSTQIFLLHLTPRELDPCRGLKGNLDSLLRFCCQSQRHGEQSRQWGRSL